MATFYNYYIETQRRQYEIELVNQDRLIHSVSAACESPATQLVIRIMENLGSKLIEWGNHLQCRCAELSYTINNRSV
jgi:hypothetical protein